MSVIPTQQDFAAAKDAVFQRRHKALCKQLEHGFVWPVLARLDRTNGTLVNVHHIKRWLGEQRPASSAYGGYVFVHGLKPGYDLGYCWATGREGKAYDCCPLFPDNTYRAVPSEIVGALISSGWLVGRVASRRACRERTAIKIEALWTDTVAVRLMRLGFLVKAGGLAHPRFMSLSEHERLWMVTDALECGDLRALEKLNAFFEMHPYLLVARRPYGPVDAP